MSQPEDRLIARQKPSPAGLLMVAGAASVWLVYPLIPGVMPLLREFWSAFFLCVAALWCWHQPDPKRSAARLLAWGLALGGVANAGYGLVQAHQLMTSNGGADVYGFLHQRNQFASLCLMAMAALAWIAAPTVFTSTVHRTAPILSVWRSAGLALGAIVLGAAVSLSSSRTGALGMVVLWAYAEWLSFRQPNAPATLNLRTTMRWAALAFVLAMTPPLLSDGPALGILARQATEEGLDVCSSRLSLWANVLELIAQRPWFGWGWGELDYAHFIFDFQSTRFCALLNNAHNLPLHIAVELGVPAALGVCILAAWAVVSARPWREIVDDRILAWSIWLVVALHSLLEYPLWYGPFQFSALMAAWVLWQSKSVDQTLATANASKSQWRLSPQMLSATVCLTMLTVAAVDYFRATQIYLPASERLGGFRTDTRNQIRTSWWFQDYIDFANLGLQDVTAGNADQVNRMARRMLHFSPEAMVVEKLLQSDLLLGQSSDYATYQQRYARAYPDAFLAWKSRQTTTEPQLR